MVAMADSPQPDPTDCFHCPPGRQALPVTYQPGAWLAQPPAESAAAGQGRPQRSDEIDASIQQALRRLQEAWPATPGGLAGLLADMKRVWVIIDGAG